MAKALLIAEKPSLMREILSVYKTMKMKDQIDFMSFAGHTMTLAQPSYYKEEWGTKKWNWDMLPIIPNNFVCVVSEGKEKMFKDIKKAITSGNYDYLINACDPDREGESIFFRVIDTIGTKLPLKRFWTNDLTETNIQKALNNLRDENEPFLKNLGLSAKLRGEIDWLIGMNLTVASTLKMNTICRVGRVKTPTLKIIVDRELEIRNFKPTTTYELEGDFEKYTGVYFNEEDNVRFKTKKEAEEFLKNFNKECIVESVEKKNLSQKAPKLYSLNLLQSDAGKIFGYEAGETLSIVQSLYEKKVLSYPRTDNPYISSELAKKFPKLLESVMCIKELENITKTVIADKNIQSKIAKDNTYVNDKAMAESGHFAITPTGGKVNISALSEDEKNIFILVCKRFLSIFLPPAKFSKTTIITNSNNYLFKTNGKILLDKGYLAIYDYKSKDTILPNINKGDRVNLVKVNVNEKISTPPPRYNDATMIDVMDNPVKFLTNENLKDVIKTHKGIGTSATRANILDELVKNGYIERKKVKGSKSQSFYATDTGISIIENLKDKDITSIDLTGVWENNLSQIEKGEMQESEFKTLMKKYVIDSINDIKNTTMNTFSNSSNNERTVVGICPKCKSNVIEGKTYYLCENYKKSCDFIIGKTVLGAKISKSEVKKMLEGKPSKTLSLTKKNGEKWDSQIIINKETGKLEFYKNNNQTITQSEKKCPCCNQPIKISDKFYMCSNYKEGCNFIISKEICGAKITEEDFETLLNGKVITKTFTWKNNKKSEAGLKLVNGKTEFIFKKN